jgi:hypothetical protein
MNTKFDMLTNEVLTLKTEVAACKTALLQASERETSLLERIKALEPQKSGECENVAKELEYFVVGSSMLREIRDTDVSNATIKSIGGACIQEIREEIKSLDITPKNIITYVGGNDLDNAQNSVVDVVSDYSLLIAEMHEKLPDTKVIISGLAPRFKDNIIKNKVKEFNTRMAAWSQENDVEFIDNEVPFELRTGEVDSSAYIMKGSMPGIHLTRDGTIRLLKNFKKCIPGLSLKDPVKTTVPKRTYAEALKVKQTNVKQAGFRGSYHNTRTNSQGRTQQREAVCWFCGVPGHTRDVCRYPQPLTCHSCGFQGHKQRYCPNAGE